MVRVIHIGPINARRVLSFDFSPAVPIFVLKRHALRPKIIVRECDTVPLTRATLPRRRFLILSRYSPVIAQTRRKLSARKLNLADPNAMEYRAT